MSELVGEGEHVFQEVPASILSWLPAVITGLLGYFVCIEECMGITLK
jgi:hypothetical protein